MKRFKQFNQVATTNGAAYATEHNNLSYDAVLFQWDGTIVGSPVTPTGDAAFRMLGTPELSQAEEPISRLSGRTLRHLGAFTSGGYSKTIAGTSGGVLAETLLDFAKIMPGAMVAGSVKSFIRGVSGAASEYAASGTTSVAGTVRPAVRSTERDPNEGHLRPRFTEFSIPIPTNAAAQQFKIDYDQDLVVAGLFLRAIDTSAAQGTMVDTLVRAIRVDITRAGTGQMEQLRYTWGQLRTLSARMAGFTDLDWDSATGAVFIPLVDEANVGTRGRLVMQAGDSIVLTIDSSATIEAHFGSPLTASNDELVVSRLDFEVIAGSQASDAMSLNMAPQATRDLGNTSAASLRRIREAGNSVGSATGARLRGRLRRGARRRSRS